MKKQIIRLTEGDLHKIIENSVKKILKENDMPLDNEMTQWKERDNDEFGTLIQEIRDYLEDNEFGEDDEYGISPMGQISAIYSMDGNRRRTYKSLLNYLTNYDYICAEGNEINVEYSNEPEIAKIMIQMQSMI